VPFTSVQYTLLTVLLTATCSEMSAASMPRDHWPVSVRDQLDQTALRHLMLCIPRTVFVPLPWINVLLKALATSSKRPIETGTKSSSLSSLAIKELKTPRLHVYMFCPFFQSVMKS
jgi:hypothetical protein